LHVLRKRRLSHLVSADPATALLYRTIDGCGSAAPPDLFSTSHPRHMPATYSPAAAKVRSPLDKLLSLFPQVRAGQALSALLLASYYVLKTVREPLILTLGGAELKSYASAGQALLLLVVVGAYSRFAARFDRIRLITGATLFFIANLAAFYALGGAGAPIGFA